MAIWRTRIGFLCLALSLTACSTNKPVAAAAEEESSQKKVNIEAAAKINVQLGLAYLEKNDIQRSKQKLLLALDQAPYLPEAWYTMAFYLEKTGNKAEAKRYYLKSIELAPMRGDIQNNYGTYLCRSGKYRESIQHFLLATKDPNYLEVSGAYENAGLCALKIPDKALAKRYFTQALEQDPSRTMSAQALNQLTQSS